MPDETTAHDQAVDVHVADEHADNQLSESKPRKKRRRRRRGRSDSGAKAAAGDTGREDGADEAKSGADAKPARRVKERIDPASAKHLFSESSFADLGLRNSVLKGIAGAGFVSPTHI